jgi:hypothetical protein
LYEPPLISSEWNNLQNGKTLEIMVPVRNLSTRDIALSKGVGLFRYYSPLAAKFLKGKDLFDQINANIKIAGKEKEDWAWAYVPNSQESIDNIIGIKMRLGPERHWIPPDINNGIINLEAEGLHHGREAVAKLRKPIPPNSLESLLWTGETTAELALDKSINALISPWVVGHPQHDDDDNHLMIGEQIMSLIIDGERTDHPVIAEIFSPTAPHLMPNWIELYFWQDIKK